MTRLSHYLCLIFPSCVFVFLSSGLHDITTALLSTFLLWLLVIADGLSPKITVGSTQQLSSMSYDCILYGLTLLQFLNIGLMLHYVSQLSWQNLLQIETSVVNLAAIRILVGTSSAISGIVVAHELIHRPHPVKQWLGRLLLYTVCYDHFIISHKQGHHPYVATLKDIATARYGESFSAYWRRVWREHFCFAWNFELVRLGIFKQSFWQAKILQSHVLQGLLVELGLVLIIRGVFGWLAALLFLYQAFAAVRILEAINYFQHWGLEQGKAEKTLSWVNQSWLSCYALIGLPNHIDHHQNVSKRFDQLSYLPAGPKLPFGYFVMNLWVKLDNPSYCKMAAQELKRYQETTALR